MGSFATFGNDLYTGRRSIDFVGRRRLWYMIGAGLVALSILALLTLKLNAGIEFRGGTQLTVTNAPSADQSVGENAVRSAIAGAEPRATKVGTSSMRISVDKLDDQQVLTAKDALAKAYKVDANTITTSFVGPSWGNQVSKKAIQGLIAFMILVSLVISIYFRTWKMAAAGLIALIHDLIITVGVYAITRFEVTPASVIGFLTILGYSLYDTVVVFDKVRENTDDVVHSNRRTFAEAANTAINQTLVRSINTSVVALLPVGSILFIGSFLLGAGTLKDISLALFVGIAAGTYSSIFIATPLLVDLRKNEPEIAAHTAKLMRRRSEEAAKSPAYGSPSAGGRPSVIDGPDDDDVPGGQPVGAGARATGTASDAGASGGGAASGTRAQPRQQPKRGSGKSRPSGRKR